MDRLPVLSHHETIIRIPEFCHDESARIQNKVLKRRKEADKLELVRLVHRVCDRLLRATNQDVLANCSRDTIFTKHSLVQTPSVPGPINPGG